MAKVLIVYATEQGQTEKIARRMTETFRTKKLTVELLEVSGAGPRRDLASFQLVVIAAPIHSVAYPKSIVRFVRQNKDALDVAATVFISVGLAVASKVSDGRAQSLAVVEKFITQTGWRPRRVELVAGALRYSQYNFFIRVVMKRISASQGGDTDTARDYEYTDWAALERLTLDLIAGMGSAVAAPSPQLLA